MDRRHRVLLHGLLAVFAGLAVPGASATEWGTLQGRFLYDGKAPPRKKVKVTTDVAVCSKHHLLDESLVVAKDGGLANVVVYLRRQRGEKLTIHAGYKENSQKPVVLDNHHCRFDPHVLLVQTGQHVVLKNSDPVGHNVNANCLKNRSFNVLLPSGGEQDLILPMEERLPVTVNCNIHPWMSSFLVVRDNPYMAVSTADGSFSIKNIPAGTHPFQFWHEKPGNLRGVTFQEGKTDRRGRAAITIRGGRVTDLGVIKVSPKLFAGG